MATEGSEAAKAFVEGLRPAWMKTVAAPYATFEVDAKTLTAAVEELLVHHEAARNEDAETIAALQRRLAELEAPTTETAEAEAAMEQAMTPQMEKAAARAAKEETT